MIRICPVPLRCPRLASPPIGGEEGPVRFPRRIGLERFRPILLVERTARDVAAVPERPRRIVDNGGWRGIAGLEGSVGAAVDLLDGYIRIARAEAAMDENAVTYPGHGREA